MQKYHDSCQFHPKSKKIAFLSFFRQYRTLPLLLSETLISQSMRFKKSTEDMIADFRGLPRMVTHSSTRDPTPLDSLLAMLKEQYKMEQPSPERSLVENWTLVFGSSLAGRCNPVRIKEEHTLIIAVTNQTLRSELQFQKRAILKRIQKLEYCGKIQELVIRS